MYIDVIYMIATTSWGDHATNIVASVPHSVWSGKILIHNRLWETMNMTMPRETIKKYAKKYSQNQGRIIKRKY